MILSHFIFLSNNWRSFECFEQNMLWNSQLFLNPCCIFAQENVNAALARKMLIYSKLKIKIVSSLFKYWFK